MKLLVLAMLVALAAPAFAAEPATDKAWDRLSQIPKTQKVKVRLQDGKALTGFIQEVASDGLTFIQKKQLTMIRRENIAEVAKKSRLSGMMWGAIVGAGLGAGIGAAAASHIVDKNHPSAADRSEAALAVGVVIGGIGAGIGAATGMERTLYRAPQRTSRNAPIGRNDPVRSSPMP